MDGMGGPFTGFDTAMLTLAQKLGLLTPTAGQDIDLDAQQAQQQAQQAQALAEHVAQRRRAQAVQQTLDRAPGPVQDIADVTQGVGRTALGLGRMVTTPPMVAAPPPPKTAPPAAAAEPAADENVHVITSPIVGTFYRAPSPEADPFAEIGQKVSRGKVLCIIESMKLMNEIESDVEGEIVEVYPRSGQPVEYGERLFAIRLAA